LCIDFEDLSNEEVYDEQLGNVTATADDDDCGSSAAISLQPRGVTSVSRDGGSADRTDGRAACPTKKRQQKQHGEGSAAVGEKAKRDKKAVEKELEVEIVKAK
jgi:hypothetical protein